MFRVVRSWQAYRYLPCTLERAASDDHCSTRFREPCGHLKPQMARRARDEATRPDRSNNSVTVRLLISTLPPSIAMVG